MTSGPLAIVEVTDDDFVAMLRGDATVRAGLKQPPGGVDEPSVLAHVRQLASNLHREGYAGGHWMMVVEGEVVGLCGFKGPPTPDGHVELGYGVAASRRRRGHATAAVKAVIAAARVDPRVRTIVAVTAAKNVASSRVLERNGLQQVAKRFDGASRDRHVLLWRKQLCDEQA